jgi:hypothetical protein
MGKNRQIKTIYVAGYLALVLFSISGLLIQGGLAMIAGLTAFITLSTILLGCLYHYRKHDNQLAAK